MYHQLSNQELKEKEKGEMHLHSVRCNSNSRNQKLRDSWTCQMRGRDQELQEVINGNLFIKNLDKSVSSLSLFKLFSSFGEVLDCKVARDSIGLSKGYGFVQYYSIESARKAIRSLDGTLMYGKKILVRHFMAKSDRERAVMVHGGKRMDSDMGHSQSLEEKFDRLCKLIERWCIQMTDVCTSMVQNTNEEGEGRIVGVENQMTFKKSDEGSIATMEEVNEVKMGGVELTDEGCANRIEEKEKNEKDPISLEGEGNEVKHGEEELIIGRCVRAVEEDMGSENEEAAVEEDMGSENEEAVERTKRLSDICHEHVPLVAVQPMHPKLEILHHEFQPLQCTLQGVLGKSEACNRNFDVQNCPCHDKQLEEEKKVTGKRMMKSITEQFSEGYKSKWQGIGLFYFDGDPRGGQMKHQFWMDKYFSLLVRQFRVPLGSKVVRKEIGTIYMHSTIEGGTELINRQLVDELNWDRREVAEANKIKLTMIQTSKEWQVCCINVKSEVQHIQWDYKVASEAEVCIIGCAGIIEELGLKGQIRNVLWSDLLNNKMVHSIVIHSIVLRINTTEEAIGDAKMKMVEIQHEWQLTMQLAVNKCRLRMMKRLMCGDLIRKMSMCQYMFCWLVELQ